MNNALARLSAFGKAQLMRFAREDEGATAVEYGLIIALIALALIGIVGGLTGALQNVFTAVTGELNTASGN